MLREDFKQDRYQYDLVHQDVKYNVEVYYFTNENQKPCILMFAGKAVKPYAHFYYSSLEERKKAKDRLIAEFADKQQAKRELAAKKRAFKHDVEIGDILHSSWGFEQTNNNFYQVIERTDKSVTIREIAYDYEATGDMTGRTKPRKDSFIGEPMQRRVSIYGYVKINSVQNAHKCDPNKFYSDSSYA